MKEQWKIWTARPEKRHFPESVCKVRIELCGTPYPIWREMFIRCRDTLTDLQKSALLAVGWNLTHSYYLRVNYDRFYDANSGTTAPLGYDGDDFWISDVLNTTNETWLFYDESAQWTHRIRVQKFYEECTIPTPFCVRACGACPPEHCGNRKVFDEMLAALQDPKAHPGTDYAAWLGYNFSPEVVSLDAVNTALRDLSSGIVKTIL